MEDIELTSWFLARGADPNAGCDLDTTPLGWAVQIAPFPVIELLFAHGGSIERGQLLHHAIWRQQDDRMEVVKYLLEKGANVNAVMFRNDYWSYLQREMLALGTPLHYAAKQGDVDLIQLFLDRGADASMLNTAGKLPHEEAQRANHIEAAELLLRHA